jgi:hypothetical protein
MKYDQLHTIRPPSIAGYGGSRPSVISFSFDFVLKSFLFYFNFDFISFSTLFTL